MEHADTNVLGKAEKWRTFLHAELPSRQGSGFKTRPACQCPARLELEPGARAPQPSRNRKSGGFVKREEKNPTTPTLPFPDYIWGSDNSARQVIILRTDVPNTDADRISGDGGGAPAPLNQHLIKE